MPWPELEKLFWYDLVDDPNAASWGLLDSTETPKDPYNAYAAVIQTLGDCTGTTPGPDAGTPTDAASPPDDSATPGPDADPTSDGAPPPTDSTAPGSDAADPGSDGGTTPPTATGGGCQCTASSTAPGTGTDLPVPLLAIMLVLGLFLLRRRS